MKETILFIDAGHGGFYKGKYYTPENIGKKTLYQNGKQYHDKGWFYEGHLNRLMAADFISKATEAGFYCIPVYHPYLDNSLKDRTDFANSMFQKLQTKALFLSFHANAAGATVNPQTSAQGNCALVYKLGSETANLALKVATEIQKIFDKYGSRRRSSLVFDQPLHITTFTQMPAILFEDGFFDNEHNADLLIQNTFISEINEARLSVLNKNLP